VDPEKRRVSLGLKQCLENPWEGFLRDHPVGSEVEGEVRNITEFGVFIGVPGDIDGMIHLSDLSWDTPPDQAAAKLKKGDRVKAKVLDVDVEKERISLGVKQLASDPFADVAKSLGRGDVVTCVVSRVLDHGIEVNVGDGVTGFIRKGDLSRDRSEQRAERFAVGDKVDAKVTSVDKATRKIALSIKALEIDEEKKAMAEFGSADSGATLGDILAPAMSSAAGRAKEEKKP
jgi:small subunit ribosomal protein S1